MAAHGANQQTTIIHIDPTDLNIMGVMNGPPTVESAIGFQGLSDGTTNGMSLDQLIQHIMEHDPKYV